ncbi:RNA polymerase-binding protein RbpA [Tessaracoccus sp. OH4464_COT-324]|uniref:RNA polymerase-binding protein RbpA n=1 Tax=Tessaracoccus sp. OH4464_COT-324 TaxID=2491059 RepID=UPI000F63FD10|nr:RNA polymerase-binding protein RbpA [Tessaracoccus sp. OH4464_COT-324]RRD48006.1 RNA polymerase-binding protein RbpA [Tessaracoccus sp. OH4464_COT-324]
MADSALRGVGLGSKTFEDEQGVEFAERQRLAFDCPKGHHFEVTFAMEADLPTEWDCKKCGQTAVRSDGVTGEPKEVKPQRRHWDMVLERRSMSELEDNFKERLTMKREGLVD